MTQELIVPAAPVEPPDVFARLVRLLEGWRDDEGTLHKGVIDRLEVIEEREKEREKARLERDAQRRIILVGLGVASFAGFVTQITTWLNTHFR